jgi:hypothetical protein
VAGGVARVSRDVDLFHDTAEAVRVSWEADRSLLTSRGYQVEVVREHGTFIEAVVHKERDRLVLQWAADSAYRFFPLVRHDDFGLTLHPFDLATNKVLALVGRLEVRDWVDVISCDERIQRLGYLAWAACGKDPGFSPQAILEQAGRSARYSAVEVAELSFDGPPPDAAALSQQWHAMLTHARLIVAALPAAQVGQCVLNASGELFRGSVEELPPALVQGAVQFHSGCIRGAVPQPKVRP